MSWSYFCPATCLQSALCPTEGKLAPHNPEPDPPDLSAVPAGYHDLAEAFSTDRALFISQVWKAFCQALGASVSLSSGFHPQTNGQCERVNQDLESALRCVAASNAAAWSTHLAWIEYAHNSLTSTATGVSPFKASLGYQPPLFRSQESKLAVPSIQHHLCHCCKVWRDTCAALLRTSSSNKRLADHRRRPAPEYKSGQKVWLSSKNIPLKTDSKKL